MLQFCLPNQLKMTKIAKLFGSREFTGNVWAQTAIGHVKNILAMHFSLEFPDILSPNLICYQWLSVSGNSEIMDCWILMHTPYWGILWSYCSLFHSPLTSSFTTTVAVLVVATTSSDAAAELDTFAAHLWDLLGGITYFTKYLNVDHNLKI